MKLTALQPNNVSPMEVINIKISKTKKCKTKKIRRVYTPKRIKTKIFLEQSTMGRIRRKAGTRFERTGQEGEETIFIPNNPQEPHLIHSQGLFLSDKGNSLATD